LDLGSTVPLYLTPRSNDLLASDDVRLSGWVGRTGTTAPTATRIAETATTGLHLIDQSLTATENENLTFTVKIKSSTTRDAYIRLRGFAQAEGVRIVLSDGSITNQAPGVTVSVTASDEVDWWLVKMSINTGAGTAFGTSILAQVRVCKPGVAFSATYLGETSEGIDVKAMSVCRVPGRHITTTTAPVTETDATYSAQTGLIALAKSGTDVKADGVVCIGSGTTWQVPILTF
jgi:hypothetical protein